MHVVATAGHVDHGKSTLVRALTGTDPDRLAEEKARGLTIDLGFAGADLPSGRRFAFIDVPGHVRFLKNMLAGVGAIDACVFVVAATEGWKPQSEEHLRILDLLGVEHGLVALTKVGSVDDELQELAILDVEEHVAGSFLEGAPIVAVDAIDDIGLGELRHALDDLLQATPTAADIGRPRLWIDRVFAAKGAGTVVTGTLAGGSIATDDELVALPHDTAVRVRGIQTLYEARDSIGPGHRVALNLSGVSHDQLSRGDVIVRDGQWHRTRRVDASLNVLDSVDHEVSRRGAHVMYVGSGEHPVRLRVLGAEKLRGGDSGLVRLHLDVELPLLPGDRYVLRESGRIETIGGGEILDVDPRLTASKAAPDRSVDRVIAERGWLDVDQLRLLTGESREPDVGRWIVAPDQLDAARARVRAAVAAAGALGLDPATLDDHERAVLQDLDGIELVDGRALPADAVDVLADHRFVALLDAEPFTPPPPEGIDRGELRQLVRRGDVVEQDGVFFSAGAIERAARIVAELLASSPQGVSVAEVRDALGTTRKYVLPILARLDGTGVTRRRDDLRIGGPRLPPVS
ncbi:MAG: selenocysteine-specific translation elongation factor [Acidimicrobiia bacterium]|nr:selenocysteine-specific translation elongation factor [Acidimicrobiia bacterium]